MKNIGSLVVVSLVSCLGGLAGACGSSGSTPGGGITAVEYNAKLATAQCAYYVACDIMSDPAICSSSIIPSYQDDTLIADVATGAVKFNATAAQACIDDWASVGCDDTTFNENTRTNTDCTAVFTGTIASGSACFFGQECSSGFCQASSTACTGECCAGTCAAPPTPAADGADCTAAGSTCAGGELCIFNQLTGDTVCTKPAASGAACVGFGQCAEGTECQFSMSASGTASATCGAPLADGAACDEMGFNQCAYTSYCEAASSTCKPLVTVGGACDPNVNAGVGNCQEFANCINAVCVQAGAAGATCNPSLNSFDCGGLLLCDSTSMTCMLETDMVCTSST